MLQHICYAQINSTRSISFTYNITSTINPHCHNK